MTTDSPTSVHIVFALDRHHPDFEKLAKATQHIGHISILSRDDKWKAVCDAHNWSFFTLEGTYKSKLNKRRWGIFRLIAGYLEHRRYREVANTRLAQLTPDLLILAKDHKDVFYYLAQYANCPTMLPQLTLYSEADLTVGYDVVSPSNNPFIRSWQQRLFKTVNNQLLKYRENIWLTLGKYLAGYRQKYISKGGNVDAFAVNGKAFTAMYLRLGLPNDTIRNVGGVEHDELYALRSVHAPHPIKQPPVIVFFLPPLFGGEPSQSAVAELKTLLKTITSKHNCTLQFKPHPLDVKKGALASIDALCPNECCTVLKTDGYTRTQDLASIIASSDLVVHSASSVVFTAAALQKPSVVYVSRVSPYFSSRYKEHYETYATYADDVTSFLDVLEHFFSNTSEFVEQCREKANNYAEDYMVLDGKVMQRYVNLCQSLLSKQKSA